MSREGKSVTKRLIKAEQVNFKMRSMKKKSKERNDDWGKTVMKRIECSRDLHTSSFIILVVLSLCRQFIIILVMVSSEQKETFQMMLLNHRQRKREGDKRMLRGGCFYESCSVCGSK